MKQFNLNYLKYPQTLGASILKGSQELARRQAVSARTVSLIRNDARIHADDAAQSLRGEEYKYLVVFLHGYGSNAADLITLAPELQQYLPSDTCFISAEAPFPCEANIHNGHQWFSLANLDEDALLKGARNAGDILNQFFDDIEKQFNIPAQNTAVIGFSQGAMMALHTAFRRPQPWAAVLGYSGKLIAPNALPAEIISKPVVGLIHGSEDTVVPDACMREAANFLAGLQVDVSTCLCPQLGHGIDYKGIKFGGELLRKVLS